MFTIDLSSKRARLALRFFTYGVMTVATVALTIICILIAMGYGFDRKDLTFKQGGLVQLNSLPGGARVTIENRPEAATQTPGKANLPAGTYKVSMNLKGYRGWTKEIGLTAGQLLWLSYVRLVPDSITTTTVHDLSSLAFMSASPDRRWILLQPLPNVPTFMLADVRDEKKPLVSSFDLPATVLTKQNNAYGRILPVEWDASSRYVLIRHELPNGPAEYIRLDRTRPNEAINLTQKYRLNITEAHFSGNNPNILFAKTDDVLRRLDVAADNASGALASGMRHFIVHGDETLIYTADRDQVPGSSASREQIVGIYKKSTETVVRHLASGAQVLFDYATYFEHDYLALAIGDTQNVELIQDPLQASAQTARTITQLNVGKPVRWVGFSKNGRMLLAQNQNDMATYDIEEAKSYQRHLDIGASIVAPLRWLDDFYLWTDAGGTLRMLEFDGRNIREITGAKPGYEAVLSGGGSQLFSIGESRTTNTLTLQASGLVVR